MRRIASVLAYGLLLSFATPLNAQRIDPNERGLWFGLGISPGSAGIDCNICTDSRKTGIAGQVQVGGTPSTKVLLGLEFNGWRASGADTTREYASGLAVVYVFPMQSNHLFVKGGFGAGRYAEESGTNVLSATGFVVAAGVGYDFRLGRRVWAAPFVNYMIAPGQNAKRNRVFSLSGTLRLDLLQVGAKLSWHSS